MRAKFLIALCSALSLCVEVYADGDHDHDHEVRRGLFPYMAFLYYPDESVVDATGARFLRGAVLIRPEWLVTSAVGPSVVTDVPNGFPRKTLLARLGAITIDANFTLNEDEDEQEREVIEIIRPYNHSATQWWRADISLMKVLLPFNLTSAVGIAHINSKLGEKTCIILVFAKKDANDTEDRTLMQLSVELMPPSIQNCGSHFSNTMTCATGSDDNKNAVYDGNFCQGNSGGPLICENEVVGIQTYIDNDCKQPHLYQLLSAWENFISCGTEFKCHEEQCSHICDIADKDAPVTSTTEITQTQASSEEPKVKLEQTESSPASVLTSTSTESTTDDSEIATTASMINLGPEETTTATSTTTTDSLSSSETVFAETPATTEGDTSETTKPWPNEKEPDDRRKFEGDAENPERKPTVEARRHHVPVRSAGPSNVSNTLSLFFGFFILACLI